MASISFILLNILFAVVVFYTGQFLYHEIFIVLPDVQSLLTVVAFVVCLVKLLLNAGLIKPMWSLVRQQIARPLLAQMEDELAKRISIHEQTVRSLKRAILNHEGEKEYYRMLAENNKSNYLAAIRDKDQVKNELSRSQDRNDELEREKSLEQFYNSQMSEQISSLNKEKAALNRAHKPEFCKHKATLETCTKQRDTMKESLQRTQNDLAAKTNENARLRQKIRATQQAQEQAQHDIATAQAIADAPGPAAENLGTVDKASGPTTEGVPAMEDAPRPAAIDVDTAGNAPSQAVGGPQAMEDAPKPAAENLGSVDKASGELSTMEGAPRPAAVDVDTAGNIPSQAAGDTGSLYGPPGQPGDARALANWGEGFENPPDVNPFGSPGEGWEDFNLEDLDL